MQWWHLSKTRRLEISNGGRWYIALTVLVGIAAINSGNNVIYLIESLLLSMLIFSGVLSETAVNRVTVTRRLGRAVVGKPVPDRLDIENSASFPIFCVEIGEWKNGVFQHIAFLPRLGAKEKITLSSGQVFAERGLCHWDGYAVATSFPFGFGRKIRMTKDSGRRIVWPKGDVSAYEGTERARKVSTEYVDGEVRGLHAEEEQRLVHWPSTLRKGTLVGRVRDQNREPLRIELTADSQDKDLERKISLAADKFHNSRIGARTLVLTVDGHRSTVNGRTAALDALALIGKGT